MASPGSLAGGLPREVRGNAWKAFLARRWAFLAGPRYDAELADGISPTTSVCHAARAGRITTPRACRMVAQALVRAVEAAELPPGPNCLTSRVPVDAGAIRVCRDQLLALADALATIKRPPARGVAIARQLALDGRSPLFLQAPDRRQGADRRLTSTLNAAQLALEVSADFDSLSASPTSTPREENRDGSRYRDDGRYGEGRWIPMRRPPS
jgi:hypothetical protein